MASSSAAAAAAAAAGRTSAFNSPTFDKDVSIFVDDDIGAASISPSGRDVVLASKQGLRVIDLDSPYELPRLIINRSPWDVADVQWSPFASRADWVASTNNQKALIYNLSMVSSENRAPVEYTLHAHDRAITDINFSAHHPEILATCGVDSFIYAWDLRLAQKPTGSFQTDLKTPFSTLAYFEAGATQVKWNRMDEHIIAASHDRFLSIWDLRRGVKPLTTVNAHATKIYGIDWDRLDRNRILTCSLDMTIKLWDEIGITTDIKTPNRIISTDYPVWRARHTPFPNGILAMAKRGSAALNLYTSHANDQEPGHLPTEPAHAFKAHASDAHVQEFLWRTRGSTDDGTDERDFQLVSWGTDRYLHLHSLKSDLLREAVGFEKGGAVMHEPSNTRKGAKYLTYRSIPPPTLEVSKSAVKPDPSQQKGNLSSLIQSGRLCGMLSSPNVRSTMSVRQVRHNDLRVANQIGWMDGVKVGERGTSSGADRKESPKKITQPQEYDLTEEIVDCSKEFGQEVNWESVNIAGRQLHIWLRGPWGAAANAHGARRPAALWLLIVFPAEYPNAHHPIKTYAERTMELDDLTYKQLNESFEIIARQHAERGRKALEAMLNYALGRQGLEESLITLQPATSITRDESSSEDESDGNEHDALTDLMNSSQSNANVPYPIQCTVRWTPGGSLVFARIPPSALSRSLLVSPFRLSRNLRDRPVKHQFESLGRLPPARHGGSPSGSHGSNSSDGSWESSSTPSSSESENEIGAPMSRFQPPVAWQKTLTSRYNTKASYQSSTSTTKPKKATSVVSILGSSVEEFPSSKKHLAVRYRIFGDGPQVCSHNADVARSFGYNDLADIWELCRLILNNQIPLEVLPQAHRREQVLVLARRALVRIKRKDSGLDLQFDEADTVTNPKLKGRIKWGHHSVVTWLIPALFDHFERLADTQMLAMLSCIFSEPAAREGVTSAMAKMRQSNLPMSMEAPAFSLDYFPSADVAWSLFKPTISNASTPPHLRHATPVSEVGWHRLTKAHDTYGSHNSSNGPWGSDALSSEPVDPYSTGNTPPTLSRAPTFRSVTSIHTPYSTSPEQSQTALKQSSTNFASAFASISRPFATALSTSPSVKTRIDDLSTSAPTNSVTWGTTTFYGSGSNERSAVVPRTKHGKRASFGHADQVNVNYYSHSEDSSYNGVGLMLDGDSEFAVPFTRKGEDGEGGASIKVTLKNQDKFDDEACASAPLLEGQKAWLYRAWREQYAEMLGCWGLVSQRAEILKFNGMVSYFPPEDSKSTPTSASKSTSKTGSINLALKREDGQDTLGHSSQPSSRATTTLPLPNVSFGVFRRSPAESLRHFSFNPEATEFCPGSSFSPEILAQTPNAFISKEQYLRFSITKDDHSDEGIGEGAGFSGVDESRTSLAPRPNLSRNVSAVSGGSMQGVATTRGVNGKKKKEPIYGCSICWIRVSGRFYLCPACGHVAHFACMDEGLSFEEGDCVVGCGCGCGFEKHDEMEEGFSQRVKGGLLPDEEDNRSYEGRLAGEVGKWTEEVAKRSVEDLKKTEKTKAKIRGKKKA